MAVTQLFEGLPPLYLLAVLGYLAGRQGWVSPTMLANLLIWFCSPAVVFSGIAKASLATGLLLLPLAIWPLAGLVGIVSLKIAQRIWSDGTERIAAFAAGTGNTGYFGIPICLALLGPEALPFVVAISFGFTAYEVSVGYFLVARGRASWREAVLKTIKLPALHAFWLGLLVNVSGVTLPAMITGTLGYAINAFTFCGMLLIGGALSQVRADELDWRLNLFLLVVKFAVWPLLALALLFAEAQTFGRLPALAGQAMLVESLVPVAANTIAYATQLGVLPNKAAWAVLISTLAAILLLPLLFWALQPWLPAGSLG